MEGRLPPEERMGFKPRVWHESLLEPFKRPRNDRCFVNSLSDFFHGSFSLDDQRRGMEVMRLASWHTYQVLTKRHERMRELMSGPLSEYAEMENLWLGVSVENKKHGLPRIDALRATPAKLRFLSVEPLLEDLGSIDLTGVHWVIVGGESGRARRGMRGDWVRSVRDQCLKQNVPFFFKQWGGIENNPDPDDSTAKERGGDSKGGCRLDGVVWHEFPAVELPPVPPLDERRRRKQWVIDHLLGGTTVLELPPFPENRLVIGAAS
jgi:protein gp37